MALTGGLLSEIKLSDRGPRFLAIQFSGQFRIREIYPVIIEIFLLAGVGTMPIGRMRAAVTPGWFRTRCPKA